MSKTAKADNVHVVKKAQTHRNREGEIQMVMSQVHEQGEGIGPIRNAPRASRSAACLLNKMAIIVPEESVNNMRGPTAT